MMCIACEQELMWLAYLESRGLTGPEERTSGWQAVRRFCRQDTIGAGRRKR